MKPSLDLNNLSHHAYYLIGGDSVRAELISTLKGEHLIQIKGNPDFFDRAYETFTIDEAREIKSLAETKPVNSSGKKIFILTMNGITVEAQNALLKLLEEPAEYAHFFLIIPLAHLLLLTVRSRMQVVETEGKRKKEKGKEDTNMEAVSFLKMPVAKRLDFIKGLMDDISKERKTKQDAIDFLNEVEELIYKQKGTRNAARTLESIEMVRKYINDRAPSIKMLMEYVALNI